MHFWLRVGSGWASEGVLGATQGRPEAQTPKNQEKVMFLGLILEYIYDSSARPQTVFVASINKSNKSICMGSGPGSFRNCFDLSLKIYLRDSILVLFCALEACWELLQATLGQGPRKPQKTNFLGVRFGVVFRSIFEKILL